jgi:hypothetical protein
MQCLLIFRFVNELVHLTFLNNSFIQKIVLYENGNSENGELMSLNSEDCSPNTDFSLVLSKKSEVIAGRPGQVRL